MKKSNSLSIQTNNTKNNESMLIYRNMDNNNNNNNKNNNNYYNTPAASTETTTDRSINSYNNTRNIHLYTPNSQIYIPNSPYNESLASERSNASSSWVEPSIGSLYSLSREPSPLPTPLPPLSSKNNSSVHALDHLLNTRLNLHDDEKNNQFSTHSVELLKRITQLSTLAVQIYFRDGQHSEELLKELYNLISQITLDDIGLRESTYTTMQYENGIMYQEIHDSPNWNMGIFRVPKGASFPLHDHPGMCVITKVLFGSFDYIAYDWVNKSQGLATCRINGRISHRSPTQTLTPNTRNIHTFIATADAYILDLSIPTYSEERQCTYYKVSNYDALYKLDAISEPQNLLIQLEEYMGPDTY